MRRLSRLGFLFLVPAMTVRAADEAPKVGDKAPEFSMVGSDGKTYKLSDFKGKKAVVVAWFPKAFTGGCTAECKSFREKGDALKGLNVAYFTASVDPAEENKKFAESLSLDYPILSDPDKAVAKAYGVLGPRGMAQRWTFYIDKDGVIKEIDKKVNTGQAAPDAAAKLKSLGLGSWRSAGFQTPRWARAQRVFRSPRIRQKRGLCMTPLTLPQPEASNVSGSVYSRWCATSWRNVSKSSSRGRRPVVRSWVYTRTSRLRR